MEITVDKAAQLLKENDNFLILTHMSPDGDTLGSAFALCRCLQKLGKNAAVATEDKLPKRFSYLAEAVTECEFEKKYIVAVDIATENLLPKNASQYKGNIKLCIDHHPSNTHYAESFCVEPMAAACAEIIFKVINSLGVGIDRLTANCLFTGITTDTGCFRYSNVTAQTMNTAARLIELGCDNYKINKLMFETNSKSRIEAEQLALSTLEYFCGGKIAVMLVTLDMLSRSGADESELDGLSAIPRTIEGVVVGVTIREKGDGLLKISVRSDETVCSANEICSQFGGGGHAAAGGCSINGMTIAQAKEALVNAAASKLCSAE